MDKISKAAALLAKLSNQKITEKQKMARSANLKKAREARSSKLSENKSNKVLDITTRIDTE